MGYKNKVVWQDEWISVRNATSRHYSANKPCELCHSFKCEPVWYSIRTRAVRCKRCFNAEDVSETGAAREGE